MHRPLLNVANPKKQIELLLKLRAAYYAKADKIIDTSGLVVQEVVAKIIRIICLERINNKSTKLKLNKDDSA